MISWILPLVGFSLFALNEIANPRRAFLGKVFWRGDRRGVALTFDDGPHPIHTPQILEVLDRFRVKGTFFVIGRHMERNGAIIADAAEAGHLIGNHSSRHSRTMNFAPRERIRQEILRCQEEVEKWIGYRPRFYRQPAGFRNPHIFGILKELGMTLVGWQVRGFDSQCKDAATIARRILRGASPGGVLLLHDGGDNPSNEERRATVEALPLIVRGLQDQGLEFFTLDRLLGMRKEAD
jgi:peptidoglycan/xylan/chitin deacetylase (PgdA/CDA1 family)